MCRDPDMLDEYDFSNGVRGKYAERYRNDLTNAQRQELDRRLERYRQDSESSGRWDEAKSTVEANMDKQPLLERITINPEICHGKPCIRDLRYPVEMLLELLAAGMSTDEVLADYEDLERDDILAVLTYATRLSQVKRMQPILA